MKTNLGKIAKLLGVSSNALRQYEKKGLIHLDRNFESNYRECNLSDIGSMINIRSLRQTGLPVTSIKELLNQTSPDGILSQFDKHLSNIDRDIQRLSAQQRNLENLKTMIIKTGYSVESMPSGRFLKYLDIQEGLNISDHRMSVIQKALSLMPETFPSIYIHRDQIHSILQNDFCASVGIFIPDSVCFPSSEAEEIILPASSVSFTIIHDKDIASYFQGALDFIRNRNAEPSGHAIGRIIATLSDSEHQFDTITRYYIPFTDKG